MVTQPDAKKISVDKTKKIEKDRSAGTDKKMDNKVDEQSIKVKAIKVNKAFNVRRGLLKLQKVVSGNAMLDPSAQLESELARQINLCKANQEASQIKQRRDVKAFQKQLENVRDKIAV